MKFGKRMQEEMLAAWVDYYFSYKRMKKIIASDEHQEGQFVSVLLDAVREELSKVEAHATSMLEELQVTFDELTALVSNKQFQRALMSAKSPGNTGKTMFPRRTAKRKNKNNGNNDSTTDSGAYSAPGSTLLQPDTPAGAFSASMPALDGSVVGLKNGNGKEVNRSVSISDTSLNGSQTDDGIQPVTAAVATTERTPLKLRSGFSYGVEERHNHSSSTNSHEEEPLTPMEQKLLPWWKRPLAPFLPYFGFGDKKEIMVKEARRRFVEWYSSATRLVHFCELNMEAVRKTAKKQAKNRPEVGDLTCVLEEEIATSTLGATVAQLHSMIQRVKADFHHKFGESLEQFEDVNLMAREVWECKWRYLFLGVALYLIVRGSPIFVNHEPAHACVALFTLVVTLWITEAIPFFCTAMLIPLVAVPSGILQDPVTGGVADPEMAAKVILSRLFDHVQVLVLGGLTIAKAMSRTRIEVIAASFLHRHTAHSPKLYLLGVMLLSSLICMFVSNIASPLLTLGVIHSTLWEFPSETNAPRGILLGLAFACNVGGMLSPISSPQNAVAMQVMSSMDISFAKWVALALPLVLAAVFAAWGMILVLWKPFQEVEFIPLQTASHSGPPVPRTHVYLVVIISFITVALWCLPPNLFFGDTGIIALIPIVTFFGVGILKKDDFNTLSWHLMFLLAGGNMLGTCAKDSKMLDLLASNLKEQLSSQQPYVTLLCIVLIVTLVTTFVSHTVAAMIMLPIIAKIGSFLPDAHTHHSIFSFAITPELLVYTSTMMCSAAMAFPISSFPNVNSLLAEDELGRPYLKAKDFLVSGQIVTTFIVACALTWFVPYFNLVML